MKKLHALLFFVFVLNFSLTAQSPFGTGQITNQNIGQLEDASVLTASQSGFGFFGYFPDAQQLLADYTFDIYVPDAYDGTEAYGLVVFINSGDNGGFKNQWLPVLDDKKLIWVAGDQIGNTIFINIRMGVGMASALRMQELFNIDPARIYTSGNSGGARMAHNLAFIYPETFNGAMPSCGGSYIRQVDQDYETQEPDGHYEAILDYPTDYLDYVLPFDQRFANMTSYNDFREGDIMNIYHNGSEVDGLKGKFLETSGNHCATTTAHFLDAVNFVEHPFLEVIQEEFDGMTTIPFEMMNATLTNSSNLQMGHHIETIAQAKSTDLFLWDDPKGAILETSVQLNSNDFNNNTSFHLGMWSMNEPFYYCGFIGNELQENLPSILLSIDFINEQPTLTVRVENPNQADTEVLFTSSFSDWNVNEALAIKYHLWDEELRIELGAHLDTPLEIETGVILLDDMRSIRIRWNDINSDFWGSTAWSDGAFLTLNSEKNDATQPAAALLIDRVELSTADIAVTTEIPNSSSTTSVDICMEESIEFNGQVITETGVYIATLLNALGCDSLVSIDVTVFDLPSVTISESNSTLSSDMNFASYQWYFNGTALIGATSNTLMATEEGEYYLEVTNEMGCSNFSNTIDVSLTSIANLESYGITIYPNPFSDHLMIESEDIVFEATLFDVLGKQVMADLSSVNDFSYLERGIYFLQLQVEGNNLMVKICKE